MIIIKKRIIFAYSLLLVAIIIGWPLTVFAVDEIQAVPQSKARIDYIIHESKVTALHNQEVFIPPELFQIWRTLTKNLNFEVGGGIDFDFSKNVERIKMSYGKEKSVTFLPDFEISWHTHPESSGKGDLKFFRPPSVEDVIIAIAGDYNLWLITTKKLAEDFSNRLILKAYSEHIERLYAVEVNIVMDPAGIYLYRADDHNWLDDWNKGRQQLQKTLLELKENLQLEVNKYFIKIAENKLTVSEAREKLLTIYREQAGLTVTFIPWDEVIHNGVHVHLNLIELLQYKRKKQ